MAGLHIPPINIPFVVAATALLICASVAKRFANQPKKADKSQKGEILKQLLALSEHEGKIPATASSGRSRKPVSYQGSRPGNAPLKVAAKVAPKISQPIRSSK